MAEPTATPAQILNSSADADCALAQGSATPTRPPRERWLRRIHRLMGFAALAQGLCWICARWDWRLDLFSHFQTQGCLAAMLALAAALVSRPKRWAPALLWSAIIGAHATTLSVYWGPNPVLPDPQSPRRLKLVIANVLCGNPNRQAVADLIRREDPDIVGLVEVTADWLQSLSEVRERYPHRIERTFLDAEFRGVALWSRQPFREERVAIEPIPGAWPVAWGQVDFNEAPLDVFLVHPSNPIRRGALNLPDRSSHSELTALARISRLSRNARIMAGDLNCSEGSPHFHDFLQISGLRDSRLGFGKQASWPIPLPLPSRISIDHAFVSPELAVVDRRLGPNVGSDHLPMIIEIAPADRGPEPK